MDDKPMMGVVVPCQGGGMSDEQIRAIRKIRQTCAIDPPPTEYVTGGRDCYRYRAGDVHVTNWDGEEVLEIERGDLDEVIEFLLSCQRANRK